MKSLNTGYVTEIDKVDKQTWNNILMCFNDASIYQTWSWGAIRWGENKLSHLILKKNRDIVAVAQVIIMRFPLINRGIAYLSWGPMWRLRDKEKDLEIFCQMIRALRNEYVIKRRFLLRLNPNIINDGMDTIQSILKDEGFEMNQSFRPYRFLLVDLSPPLETLRKGLNQKWRNCLNRSEKNHLKVIEGCSKELFGSFEAIYREMKKRKKFTDFVNVEEVGLIQNDLPDDLKMRIMLCEYEGEGVASVVIGISGDTGIYLLGASNDKGRKIKGSYLLQWRMIGWFKEHGYRYYNLGGINPNENRNTYHFKAGLSGKNGIDISHISQFDACEDITSSFLVMSGDILRSWYNKIRKKIVS